MEMNMKNTVPIVLTFVSLLYNVSVSEVRPLIASILIQEGQSAQLSCLVKGTRGDYFWRKGESLHNSTGIASFVGGIPIEESGPYISTENGTLIIDSVTLKDEGKYICRLSSEDSDCHGEVVVYVQASIHDFGLAIDICNKSIGCLLLMDATQSKSLTCTATHASPSMKLKWFNGSTLITDGIEEHFKEGKYREISSTINDVYGNPASLTCQAVDSKRRNDDGKFAHVLVKPPVSSEKSSPGWLVTAIIFILGCAILIVLLVFITVRPKGRKGKEIEAQSVAEDESLLSEAKNREKELNNKNTEISNLNSEAKNREKELNNKNTEISNLNQQLVRAYADKMVIESTVSHDAQKKNTDISSLMHEAQKKDTHISSLRHEAQTKDTEISRLKHDAHTKDTDISRLKHDAHTKDTDISRLKGNEKKQKIEGKALNEREAHIQKQLVDLDKRSRKFREDQFIVEDPIRINCRMISGGVDTRVASKEQGGTSKVKMKSKWSMSNMEATFNIVYPSGIKPSDLFESIEDLIENTIIGKKSCIIAHDVSERENWTTMFGTAEGAVDALIPSAIKRILERADDLTAIGYEVSVGGKFVKCINIASEDCVPSIYDVNTVINNQFQEVTDIDNALKVDIADMKVALEQMRKCKTHGTDKEIKRRMDNVIQFYVESTIDGQSTSGVISFATFGGMQLIKECLRVLTPTKQFTQNIADFIHDDKCRSILITHLHEENYEETKKFLGIINSINTGKKLKK